MRADDLPCCVLTPWECPTAMDKESPRLLLVESDELLADITAFRLELLGYDVTMADSGGAAFTMLESSLPDLIILDLHLADMEGLDMIDRLSNDARTSSVAILAFSIDADLDSVQRAYAAGARDYVVVPYDPAVLESKIESLLHGVKV